MAELPTETEEADALLAQAARMDFAFARHVQAQALATDDAGELADLARAYARLTRSMRQNLALLTRQKDDREKARREAAQADAAPQMPPGPDLRRRAVDARTAQVQAAVDRVISAAAAGDEARHTDWCHRFDREVDDWTEADDWLADDVDAVVVRACRTLGLPEELAQRWRDLPEPTFFPDPEEVRPATPALTEAWPPPDADRPRPDGSSPEDRWRNSS